ncbi:hypothetical protein GIB67_005998 [Kingdonia uniflora]|uniref:Mitochondrial carrier protein n=1 Tax=Kingdonia uniflora TaxID=39325 RepID=A0A7J7MC34_9MAGN|nr:hypothetical protein GIB67_005998 [Kingdonia uniflora]
MSLSTADEDSASEIHLPGDIDWQMLDKSKFFFLGAALFSGVSTALYPTVVLKTKLQTCNNQLCCFKTAYSIFSREGIRGLYKGYCFSIAGTVPARAVYITALEMTKSNVGNLTVGLGVPEPTAAAIANATAGLSASMAAQLIWTPVDVVTQRLMVQSGNPNCDKYRDGMDALRKIFVADGVRGLYRGFGMSIVTYAPSNALWWASYSVTQRLVWSGLGCYQCKREDKKDGFSNNYRPDLKTVMGVQGISAAMAGGISALITMPLDTIKTRLQVLDREDNGRRPLTVRQTLSNLVKEGGWAACYRGLGPRWFSMSLSATTMITTYEFLKRMSTKNQDRLT